MFFIFVSFYHCEFLFGFTLLSFITETFSDEKSPTLGTSARFGPYVTADGCQVEETAHVEFPSTDVVSGYAAETALAILSDCKKSPGEVPIYSGKDVEIGHLLQKGKSRPITEVAQDALNTFRC